MSDYCEYEDHDEGWEAEESSWEDEAEETEPIDCDEYDYA